MPQSGSHPPGRRISLGDKLDLLVDEFAPAAPTHIFNSPEFFRLHAGDRAHFFQLVERKNGEVLAAMHFTEVAPGHFRSPARGTFGGISAASELTIDKVEAFAGGVVQALREAGAAQLQVVLPPASHDPALLAQGFNAFARLGFGVQGQELNYDIEIDAAPLASHMDYGNRKRLNKCVREGFVAERLGADRYEAAYLLIAENRRRKDYPVTMDFPSIMTMVNTFGDRMRFFGVLRDGNLVASAVCILVSADVLSVFYWGDSEGVQEYSPVTLLAAHIYDHCRENAIRRMDTGIGTEAGDPNHGLIRFKRALGLRESLKLIIGNSLSAHA